MEEIKKEEEFMLDLFAKDAMQGLLNSQDCSCVGIYNDDLKLAEKAFDISTAMILERRKRLKKE